MLKIEKFVTASPEQMEMIIEGMRNPMNSWDRSDSHICAAQCNDPAGCEGCPYDATICPLDVDDCETHYMIGPNDHELMMSLAKGGPVHAKYRRMMPIFVTITAPLYWWKEFDTYKVGTVANSCSTMHKIHAKEFTLEDFSVEHLMTWDDYELPEDFEAEIGRKCNFKFYMSDTIVALNNARDIFLAYTKKLKNATDADEKKALATWQKRFWWQMIQLLPTSYNQTRTVLLNYEVAHAMRKDRRHHKLDEWHVLCDFFESLPYSEVSAPEG